MNIKNKLRGRKLVTSLSALVFSTLLAGVPVQGAEMKLADLHFHPESKISPAKMLKVMDGSGVQWAGLGIKGISADSRGLEADYLASFGGRLIAFGGQSELNLIFKKGGMAAAESAQTPAFKKLMARLEEDLKSGRIKGIGEIFVNNKKTSKTKWMRRKMKTDAASLRAVFALAAKYKAVVGIHMEWQSDSVKQLENVMKASPGVKLLLNHCGSENKASELKPFLKKFSNAYCEFSMRYPPLLPAKAKSKIIFTSGSLNNSWKELIEEYPDRFMIGTDAHNTKQYTDSVKTVRSGLLAKLSPKTAKMVAYGNARKLFDLK